MSTDYSTKEEKRAITDALAGMRFDSPYGKEVQKFVKHGIGLHHAGLLPKYRLMVEKLAQKGHLKVICGTDTLGVGVNVPIRTVLFTKLCKFDGQKTTILSVRDFRQIAGRAGRRGFDVLGSVVVQAPEHVIENLRLEAKAGNDPAKKRKIVRKKPPEKGYVHWDRSTFDRLITSPPEPLVSRFSVSHGMLLNVLSRESGGCRAMARIVKRSHERPPQKRILGRTAIAMFKSLVDAKIVHVEDGRVVIDQELQDDFSLNQTLSLYLLETIDKLDRENNPLYALDLLSLVEAILENPEIVLMKQLDRLKTEKLAELKAAGVEYDDRIAELEKLDYPKPNRDFTYATYNEFSAKHPWVGQENIRPKSIAREMFEAFQSFGEYVRDYELQRAEGTLLRYLSDVYKTLVQTVPARAKDDVLEEIVVYFRTIVRAVDSSLIDEWERMRTPGEEKPRRDEEKEEEDITRDTKAFTVLVRNEVFALLRLLSRRDYAAAAAMLDPEEPWTAAKLDEALKPFFAEHAQLRTDPKARSPENTRITKTDRGVWEVEQVLSDPEEANDWALHAVIDLAQARKDARPTLRLLRVAP
jgi:superfamily II RNA helicase